MPTTSRPVTKELPNKRRAESGLACQNSLSCGGNGYTIGSAVLILQGTMGVKPGMREAAREPSEKWETICNQSDGCNLLELLGQRSQGSMAAEFAAQTWLGDLCPP